MNLRYVLSRLLGGLLTLLLIVTLTFFALRLSGDPIQVLLPDTTPQEVVELYRERWGLDQPLAVQYVKYVVGIFHGDFGLAFSDGRSALQVVLERVPATAMLALAAIAIGVICGIGGGIVAALNRNSAIDRAVIAFAVFGYAVPNFFFGILLILLFTVKLGWLPSSGSGTIWHLIMPALTLGLWASTPLARITRASVLETLGQPYMVTVRAKGLPYYYGVFRHALPNAAIPIITILGLNFGTLIGGAVITETVFAWPGIGRLTVSAVANRELAIVQVIVLFVATIMVSINLVVDLLYTWIDPRISVVSGRQK
ncbi:ABC transporter permease [Aquamicrobium sp. LC103]|uniref:ABC transporter permease n=1 Tax=Aquamicrobium sp. LC103 TaxID=1120658 RepID=UPI00063ECEDD|nr:ABC transporter permease [Aquamicrobium sp. LC103]TKT82429.1 ABC transporter permease [Aquamicrobium sp. LC103]